MHLKQVVICGFRSYRDEIHVAPFSPEHNVVLGRNGSGKSNFFDAIRFALLSGRFANLRPEDRQALLHEGAGRHVMSAYVEVIFDNEDGRLQVDAHEVVLRRTIGVKKDEFMLNKKSITKSDVIQMLEGAGFSRANPYYIVQQGKINALAVMKEHERLELLKEVAGTNVYEDRRQESLQILQDSKNKQQTVDQSIEYIEERLQELENEKEELVQFQQLDREQRALAYTMHQQELRDVRIELQAVDQEKDQDSAKSTELRDKQLRLTNELQQLEANEQSKKADTSILQEQKSRVEAEKKELMENLYQLQLEVAELGESASSGSSRRSQLSRELSALERSIQDRTKQLKEQIVPEINRIEEEHEQVLQTCREQSAQSEQLIARQSRSTQFNTQEERDTYLRNEIKELETLVERKRQDAAAVQASTQALDDAMKEAEEHIQEQESQLQTYRDTIERLNSEIVELKEQRNALSEQRKDKWRTENQLDQDVRQLTETVSRGESVLHSTMASDVRRGLEAVREMSSSGRVRGIYGPIIELVEPMDERFCIAVDEAAGSSLFHVVVDSDETAAKAMKELEKESKGRLTFLPLNRLQVADHLLYPQSEDVMPLLERLEYPSEVEKAVRSVFGKKLLCRNLDACVQYAEQTDMDCLTLDGDVVHRRGALNGGFKELRRSRTKAMMEVRAAKKELETASSRAKEVKEEAQQTDQQVAHLVGEIQKKNGEKQHTLSSYEQLCDELAASKKRLENDRLSREHKIASIKSQEEERQDLETTIASYRQELESEMQADLSSQESESLHQLSSSLAALRKQERELRNRKEELRARKDGVEAVLSENLFKRRNELRRELGQEGLEQVTLHEQDGELRAKQLDMENADALVQQNALELASIEKRSRELQDDVASGQVRQQEIKTELETVEEELEQEQHETEKIYSRRSRLLQRHDVAMREIQALGTLPSSELEKFKDLPLKQVAKQYRDKKEQLRAFSHVNGKALDQYVSFSTKRGTLVERKRELEDAYTSIQDLMEVLDQRKDEAILKTFKGVSHHFSEVFQELVPTGEGKMLIIRDDPSQSQESTEGENTPTNARVESFSGVQIKVNFRGEGDSYLMQQLSGGQKSLVALAFIFAIQRCDPAPFYLFDEIDQALDTNHRAAVARLIQRQAHSSENPAQFITSTFGHELVKVADQFYGIGFQDKVSQVYTMTPEDSLDFISNIIAEEDVTNDTNK